MQRYAFPIYGVPADATINNNFTCNRRQAKFQYAVNPQSFWMVG